jgi:hypothetical protein
MTKGARFRVDKHDFSISHNNPTWVVRDSHGTIQDLCLSNPTDADLVALAMNKFWEHIDKHNS